MSVAGGYILYQFIEYIKSNDRYDIKNMKKELTFSFSIILVTIIYLISLLII